MRLLDQALAQAGSTVYILVRARDLYPVSITSNFERMFLLPPDRIEDDIEAISRLLTDESRLEVRRLFESWDRVTPCAIELAFIPDGMADARRVRALVSTVNEGAYYLVEFNDITREDERVASLEDKVSGLSSDTQIKSDFLNRMSHEIRTPLGGIIGMLSLARDHMDNAAELRDDLDKVEELGNYLMSLVNDILDMSRIESGKVELEKKAFDLETFAEELRTLFGKNAADSGIAYEVKLEDCPVHYVMGDRLRLSQVLVNLISNALKFTPSGGRVDVTIKQMYRTDDMVRIMMRVRDTGKGMDPQFLGRIFRPFEQEDASVAQKYGGSGLGMAIADSLVGLMGGEIVVDSEVGRGSEFALYLPFSIASSEDVEEDSSRYTKDIKFTRMPIEVDASLPAPTAPSESVPPSILNGMRILMAEDNNVNAKITSSMLAKRGANVERACDGQEALDMFSAHDRTYYDAILMDIKMPVMDGWEASKHIRELPDGKEIIIVALSANAYVEDARHSQALGLDGHVGKPIDFDELEAVLERAHVARQTEKSNTAGETPVQPIAADE